MAKTQETASLTTSPKLLLHARNIRAKKTLGQHFLSDSREAEKIISLSEIDPGETVLEIGSGLGALTVPAAARAKHLIAVETDPRLTDVLKAEVSACGFSNVTFIEKDILKIDLKDHIWARGDKLVVLGNLPYHISTPILVRLVASRQNISRAVLMFQKEVADRIVAPPGKKARGRLSVLVQYCATVSTLLDVPASLFFPRPKVDSRVVKITFDKRSPLSQEVEKRFFQIVGAAFGKRRKTLKNALSGGGLDISAETADQALILAGIDPKRRAETLEIAEFLKLHDAMEALT